MNYELIEKQIVHRGKIVGLDVHHLRDDSGTRHTRDVVVHPGAVVILPMLDERTVVLIRNFRYAVRETLLELPAGTLEKGEDPRNAAGRELLEETGYLAGNMRPMVSFYSSPGVMTERLHSFLATKLQLQQQDLDEGEQIEVVPMPYDEAIDSIATGTITDGKTIAALLTYDRLFRGRK